MKKFTLLLILVLFRTVLSAQIPIQTFEDTELKPVTKVQAKFKTDSCLYIGGHSWDVFHETPYVTKIDGNGKVAWRWTSTTPGFETTYAIMACDSSVYAITNKVFASSNFQIYKLKSNDGSVVWSTTFSNNYWDDNSLLHNYTDSTAAFLSSFRFVLFNKSTGTVLENLTLPAYANIRPAIDPYGYIYCAGKDTIYKFDNLNHDSLIWKRTYNNFPTSMEYPSAIYADSTNLFIIGESSAIQSQQLFMKFDPANGNVVYSTILSIYELAIRDLLDKDGFIYGAESGGMGSSIAYVRYFKIEKQTGSLAWYRMEQLDTLPNIPYLEYGVIVNYKDYELVSIDVDSLGDLYGTGFYRGSSFGTCFIFKASGTDGSILWQHTVIDDSSRYDTFGGGTVAWVNNNRAYFVERLKANVYDKNDYNVITEIVEADTSTGVILNKVYDGGGYKFASKVVDLKYLPNGNIISFVQLGRGVQVLCSDTLLNLIWEKRFFYDLEYTPYHVLKADKIAIGDNGTIAFCATIHSHEEYITDTQYPDTIYYYRLDSAGTLLSRTAFGFPQPLTDSKVVFDLTYDGTHGMLYFFDGTMIKFLLFNNGNFQYNVTVPNSNTPLAPTSIGTDLNSQFALYTRFVTGGLHLIKYDKTIGYGYNLDTIPGMYQRSIVYKIDANRVLISGLAPLPSNTRVTMYDWVQGDTLWTSDLAGSNQTHIRVVYDSLTNAIYAVREEMLNKLSFERFNATTGQLLWATSFANNLNITCNDLVYDSYNHKLIGVGSIENGFNDYSAIMWTFDSSGVAIDTIVALMAPPVQRVAADNLERMSVAASYNQSEATAALVINSQRVLIAACTLNSSVTTGAYFDLSPSGIFTAISPTIDASKNILVFPNPFKSGVNIKLPDEGVHTLTLFDVQGRYLQSSVVDSPSQEMYYLDLSTVQSGYYILQVTDKKQQYNFKIVKQ